MKKTTLALAAAAMLATVPAALTSPALAQGHAHGQSEKGPNGGMMQDVAGVHAELVAAERTLTVHLYDEAGKPVPAAGYSGSVLAGTGQARQVVQLAPGTGNTLSGTAPAAVARNTQVTLQLKAPGGKTGQARF